MSLFVSKKCDDEMQISFHTQEVFVLKMETGGDLWGHPYQLKEFL